MSNADTPLQQRLATAHTEPGLLGPAATARRAERHGDHITLRAAPSHPVPESALVLRGDAVIPQDTWPTGSQAQPGDRWVISVPATLAARERFIAWLGDLELPAGCSVAPCSTSDSGLHRLWCIGAARIVLSTDVRIEARHDLLGIRLAQLALAMGADTLSGPFEVDRSLPLAGVPRPNESTHAGLAALVRNAGLTPQPAGGSLPSTTAPHASTQEPA